jgi:CheY-like chemotaxis protein
MGPPLVLVVDDDPGVRAVTSRLLSGAGYAVLDAEDGRGALDLLQHVAPAVDLVLTDLRMPGMSGTQLARAVSELRPDLPVLYMTGFSEDLLDRLPDDARGTRVINKPFENDEVLRLVARWLPAT